MIAPVSLVRQDRHGHNFLTARPKRARYQQPKVFIHGMAGFAAYLGDAMLHSAHSGFVCNAHDITGHGEREGEDISGLGVLDYVHDASNFIDRIVRPKHGDAPIILIGHSMGGLIAAKLAEIRDDVGHVVLVTPAPPRGVMLLPGGMLSISMSDVFGAISAVLGGKQFAPSRRLLESLFADPEASRHIIDLWEKRKINNESLSVLLQLGLSQVEVDKSKITAPMLVIGAKRDVVVHHSVASRVAEHFGADLHIHEELGHMCPFEAGWEENSRVITEWLLRQGVR